MSSRRLVLVLAVVAALLGPTGATPQSSADAVTATTFVITGRGWGHGVGLCQVGAYGMAVRGHDYRDILAHYYSGTRLGGLPPHAAAASVAMRERAAYASAASGAR